MDEGAVVDWPPARGESLLRNIWFPGWTLTLWLLQWKFFINCEVEQDDCYYYCCCCHFCLVTSTKTRLAQHIELRELPGMGVSGIVLFSYFLSIFLWFLWICLGARIVYGLGSDHLWHHLALQMTEKDTKISQFLHWLTEKSLNSNFKSWSWMYPASFSRLDGIYVLQDYLEVYVPAFI